MKGLTVILAAGDFPRKGGEAWRLLAAAECVIACDSAAFAFKRHFRRHPDVIIGDMDSLPRTGRALTPGDMRPATARGPYRIVRDPDQSTNDLSKAIAWADTYRNMCRKDGLVIVGATGKREDHTIGNVYRALEAGIRIVSDEGEFLPVKGTLRFKTWKDAGVSVFAPDPRTKMTSRGLRWKLDGVRFANPYCATLNRASSERVTVVSDRPAYVYVAHNSNAVRAIVSLGSNLGNRAMYLRRAVKALSALPETRLLAESEVIETEGVDVPDEFASLKFLNQVVLFETTLAPLVFSRAMHAIEDRLGRVRTVRNGPRTIDIDLIDYGGLKVDSPELKLPHPRARSRDFVTSPMRSLGLFVV